MFRFSTSIQDTKTHQRHAAAIILHTNSPSIMCDSHRATTIQNTKYVGTVYGILVASPHHTSNRDYNTHNTLDNSLIHQRVVVALSICYKFRVLSIPHRNNHPPWPL
ncbi:hypothetical protein BU24DRAFT_195261 [Aaosphaeria arxii CBS 175.79]|uniref:Uncharacterized protein n=1 Tax=Aaosphaeria arxii CBS 175.79 TaxID=1450172 RepID=A0A6A5XS89_9PLEO|nr:uncharacterized protein BU24DRAFT_195261 [Aaosphaeria arxii CBS 175.79]KAF2016168.1 hypothetical protein BU24DRAFT_195261 [Aaosphaeria arxii CBS 175.79]